MTKKFIVGGCSFTLGNELSDDKDGKTASKKSWAHGLYKHSHATGEYVCTAFGGLGNQAIARRVFSEIANSDVESVVVMWSFLSRYDWAMPRHKLLEDTRWASISPWDANVGAEERHRSTRGSETQRNWWSNREKILVETGIKPFAESIYRHASNQYHEIYLSWKSIIWLQNILEKKKIPFMFTLADNSLFYQDFTHHKEHDSFMNALYSEIDISKWFGFGERMMGFNQWAKFNEYEYGVTHPLDKAHEDAIMLMKPEFDKIIGGQK